MRLCSYDRRPLLDDILMAHFELLRNKTVRSYIMVKGEPFYKGDTLDKMTREFDRAKSSMESLGLSLGKISKEFDEFVNNVREALYQ